MFGEKQTYSNSPPAIDYVTHNKAVMAIFDCLKQNLPECYYSYSILALILEDAKRQLDYFKIRL